MLIKRKFKKRKAVLQFTMASQTAGQVQTVEDDASFQRYLIQAEEKLVVVDFFGPRY